MAERTLRDCRILLVEDEYLLAMALQDKLQDLHAVVLGPVSSLEDALALIRSDMSIDGAVLDINLGGTMAYPAADLLLERNIPFVFTTGYDKSTIPDRFGTILRLHKPFDVSRIVQAIGCPL